MLTPIRCGRINSIDIKIAPIVVILLLALVINSPNLLIPLIMLMVFLLAHELGHGIIAQRLGLNVTHIIITPLGGMASIEDLSQRPLDEVKVALAGPLVNLVLAAACLLLPNSMQTIAVLINLGLGLGNLVPLFPLDGGRIIRGCFSAATNPVDAIYGVSRITKYLCILLLLLSIKYNYIWFGLALCIYCVITYKKEMMVQIMAEGRPPSMTLGEIVKHTFNFLFKQPKKQSPPIDESLEDFGGSLDEFFNSKDK